MSYIKNLRGKKRYAGTVHVTLPDGRTIRREKIFQDSRRETKRLAEKWEIEERERILEEEKNRESKITTGYLSVQEWVNNYLDDVQRKGMSGKTYYEKRAGVKPFGFHAIRHFTASYLFAKGQSVSVIQQILRHKNPNTTTRYLRKLGLETDSVRSALEEVKRETAEVIFLDKKTSK